MKIIVTGDITIDWLIAQGPTEVPTNAAFNPDRFTQAYHYYGGARSLGELLKKGLDLESQHDILIPGVHGADDSLSTLKLTPGAHPFWHGYATAKAHTKQVGSTDKKTVWRIDQFLGIDRQYRTSKDAIRLIHDDVGDSGLIVLDDAGQGFMEEEDVWPESLKNPRADSWLILKLARPSFQNPHKRRRNAWEYLAKHFKNRIILIVTANDLRDANFEISKALSWE